MRTYWRTQAVVGKVHRQTEVGSEQTLGQLSDESARFEEDRHLAPDGVWVREIQLARGVDAATLAEFIPVNGSSYHLAKSGDCRASAAKSTSPGFPMTS